MLKRREVKVQWHYGSEDRVWGSSRTWTRYGGRIVICIPRSTLLCVGRTCNLLLTNRILHRWRHIALVVMLFCMAKRTDLRCSKFPNQLTLWTQKADYSTWTWPNEVSTLKAGTEVKGWISQQQHYYLALKKQSSMNSELQWKTFCQEPVILENLEPQIKA